MVQNPSEAAVSATTSPTTATTGTGTGAGGAHTGSSQNHSTSNSSGSKNRNIIASHYQIAQKIGEGSFGIIFKGYDLLRSNQPVAIKFESRKSDAPQLKDEFRAYKVLNSAVNNYYKNYERERYRYLSVAGIPKVYYFGQEGYYNILIIQLLGPSLEDLFEWCGRKFSIPTVSRLAIQMIERIQFLHENNLIYRDIKPDNFLIGATTSDNTIYMVDYGMVKQYRDPITHVHIPYRERKSLSGTARYMSINTHLGREQSRRDDLESLGNVFVYFLKGQLPWQGLKAPTNKLKYEKIGEKKQKIPIPELCSGLPLQVAEYIRQVRALKFEEDPDYLGYINLFRSILENFEGTKEYAEVHTSQSHNLSSSQSHIQPLQQHEQIQQQQQQLQSPQSQHQNHHSVGSLTDSIPESKSSDLSLYEYDWMKLNDGAGWSWGKNKKINLNGYGSGVRHTATQQTHLSNSQYNQRPQAQSAGQTLQQQQQQQQQQQKQQQQQQQQQQQRQQLQQQQQYYQSQQPNSRSMSHSHSNGHYYVNNGGSSNKALLSGKSRAASTSVVNERTGLLESSRRGYMQGGQHHNNHHGPGGDDSNYEMQNGSWLGWLCCCRWW